MSDRLSPLDVSFLYLEEPTAVQHVGSVAIFELPHRDFAVAQLQDLVAARIAYLPRYRQRVRLVPGRLAAPLWVDDTKFELDFHVRRAALPEPGGPAQLADLVGRILARPLARNRPLWELYLVEGVADGRFAIITKAHQALVDGIHAVDIIQLLLDRTPRPVSPTRDTWSPRTQPSDLELIAGALTDAVRSPGQLVGTLRGGVDDLFQTAGRITEQGRSLLRAVARTATRPAPICPLNVQLGEQRRFAMVETRLAEHRAVRERHARRGQAEITINDVVLTVITGALRAWLLARGEPVLAASVIRALVPVSVLTGSPSSFDRSGDDPGSIAGFVVDLPVGEPNPVIRLHQVSYDMRSQAESGRAVRAQTLVNLAGFAPPTLHSLGARVAAAASRRLTNLTITNVPGPQHELFASEARMIAAYPVMPLAKGQGLALGVNSYHGKMLYGLTGDMEALSDLEVLAQCLTDALAELHDAPSVT